MKGVITSPAVTLICKRAFRMQCPQFHQKNLKMHWKRNIFRCDYNWINQLSNTTIWWLDICCLLHRYQLHVLPLMAIFRLIDWQQTCKQLYFGMCRVYGREGLGLDGGTRSHVCWVGRVMWVHGYYCVVHGYCCVVHGYYCVVHGYYCAGRPAQ